VPGPPVERRQALRFPMTLPVELERGSGITRNISTSGVFFETDQVFSTGDPIRLTLVLEPTCPGIPTRLHCQGQIVRAEQQEEKMGVAVAFTSYRFEPLGGLGER
jgi:hypothetical protein